MKEWKLGGEVLGRSISLFSEADSQQGFRSGSLRSKTKRKPVFLARRSGKGASVSQRMWKEDSRGGIPSFCVKNWLRAQACLCM